MTLTKDSQGLKAALWQQIDLSDADLYDKRISISHNSNTLAVDRTYRKTGP